MKRNKLSWDGYEGSGDHLNSVRCEASRHVSGIKRGNIRKTK
jgi:hypothetical protein